MFSAKRGKTVYNVDIRSISRAAYQPRRQFDRRELEGMAESIRKNGVLEPLIIRKTGGGYELISGERRLRAAKIAGLDTVPCLIISVDDRRSILLSLSENMQRKNLDFFEEAEGIKNLIDEWGLTNEETAIRLGKSRLFVTEGLRLLSLCADEQTRIVQNGLSENQARSLLRICDRSLRADATDYIIRESLNDEQTEQYIDKLLDDKDDEKNEVSKPMLVRDLRLFMNTVTRAAETMKKSGALLSSETYETDEFIEYRVKICKQEKADAKKEPIT